MQGEQLGGTVDLPAPGAASHGLVYALSVCLTHWTEGSETEEPGQVVAEEALGRRPGPTPSTDTCKSMNGTQAE